MTRHAIVGSREYADLAQVERYVRSLPLDTVIVSGGARGVDFWAAEIAKRRGMPPPVELFAEWHRYGKRAGPLRNQLVVDGCDILTAFLDISSLNGSPGTHDVVRRATYAGKLFKVFAPGDALILPA